MKYTEEIADIVNTMYPDDYANGVDLTKEYSVVNNLINRLYNLIAVDTLDLCAVVRRKGLSMSIEFRQAAGEMGIVLSTGNTVFDFDEVLTELYDITGEIVIEITSYRDEVGSSVYIHQNRNNALEYIDSIEELCNNAIRLFPGFVAS